MSNYNSRLQYLLPVKRDMAVMSKLCPAGNFEPIQQKKQRNFGPKKQQGNRSLLELWPLN